MVIPGAIGGVEVGATIGGVVVAVGGVVVVVGGTGGVVVVPGGGTGGVEVGAGGIGGPKGVADAKAPLDGLPEASNA